MGSTHIVDLQSGYDILRRQQLGYIGEPIGGPPMGRAILGATVGLQCGPLVGAALGATTGYLIGSMGAAMLSRSTTPSDENSS
mmetsp:Transcript_22667/g.27379  ORF Transcript_22667/g.27379 Transcript_22667/m.27379 type:complete len:83 (+) Transcript_22667:811-1059(+)|eukprot:CAMPEP_0197851488 /NCGR_PEP_ID=MMETSP1438-20131217/18222_1 /TAXON_ID=1461541 /ORGANISM="Pterosperma sp., Strain CCMP1384" /LENGTH=82 /DNA_ID=CAMNT_0043465105 /DNA_START=298 /DNA_END=546 /DNA_ORIENTATION=+